MAEKGEMTIREAGRRGGTTTAKKYGREHYERIGKIGGTKGGNTTKQRYGHEFYKKIGTMGGGRVRELIAKAKELEGK